MNQDPAVSAGSDYLTSSISPDRGDVEFSKEIKGKYLDLPIPIYGVVFSNEYQKNIICFCNTISISM